ncbi:hypothetical protein JW998_09175 [candidate division KSB1 bacterium]|nr:hypothetical protein [candidate division KSB1 bacterium]
MPEPGCANCAFRAKYDNKPTSFLGRLWRWHISFCPGWKSYMSSLSRQEQMDIAQKYQIKKYLL